MKKKCTHLITYMAEFDRKITYKSITVETKESFFSIKEWNDFVDRLSEISKNFMIINDVLIKN